MQKSFQRMKHLLKKLHDFITNPVVVPILLSIAGLGLVLELYSPGFGVPGTMAIISLLLFFYGHLVAGLAGYETIILVRYRGWSRCCGIFPAAVA